MKHFLIVGLFGFTFILSSASLNAGQYFQDFTSAAVGATNFSDGTTFSSTDSSSVAGVLDATYKELRLTASDTANSRSAFLLPDLDSGKPVYAFSAKWSAPVYANFPNAAEGFSFTFGQVGSLNLISNGYAQEDGYGTGITFSVRNFTNPGFYLKINGTNVASQAFAPATRWGVFSSARHFFEVDWNYATGITVRVDGQTIFANVPTPGLTIQSGSRFVWAARCSSFSEDVRLDNIVVTTGGNLVQAATTSPYFSNQGSNPSHQSSTAFDGDSSTFWAAFSSTGNIGATVSPAVTVGAYVLVSSPDTGSGAATDPRNWTLEGSNNSGTDWASCGAGGGYFVNRQETRAWLATNSTSYGAYRLNISQNNGSGSIALGELRFYKFLPVEFNGVAWAQCAAPAPARWESVTSSSSGQYLAAALYDRTNQIYTSTNYGASWSANTAGSLFDNYYPNSIASSADGSKLVLGASYSVLTSTDYGKNWTARFSDPRPVNGVASSADGNKLGAVAYLSGIYNSSNGGGNWSFYNNNQYWWGIASSTNGNKMAAMDQNRIFVTSDSGTNWTLVYNAIGTTYRHRTIASSADGTKLAVAYGDGGILASTNSGGTWFFNGAPALMFSGLAMSADGTRLVAGHIGGAIYISTDSGNTWTPTLSTNENWTSIASSSDGSRLVAVTYFGGIWTNSTYSPSAPTLTNASASSIRATAVTLNASVAPNGLPPSVWFQWGTTTDYGNNTTVQTNSDAFSATPFNCRVTGILPGATYHFRAVGSNTFGLSYSSDVTFTTLATLPPPQLGNASVSNGVFRFTFTNSADETFTVLTSTNISLPLTNWTVLGSATEGPSGQFQFNDPQAMTNRQRFYRVRWP